MGNDFEWTVVSYILFFTLFISFALFFLSAFVAMFMAQLQTRHNRMVYPSVLNQEWSYLVHFWFRWLPGVTVPDRKTLLKKYREQTAATDLILRTNKRRVFQGALIGVLFLVFTFLAMIAGAHGYINGNLWGILPIAWFITTLVRW